MSHSQGMSGGMDTTAAASSISASSSSTFSAASVGVPPHQQQSTSLQMMEVLNANRIDPAETQAINARIISLRVQIESGQLPMTYETTSALLQLYTHRALEPQYVNLLEQWLIKATSTKNAWDICLRLLTDGGNKEVQSFAARTLFKNVLNSFSENPNPQSPFFLTDQERQQLCERMLAIVKSDDAVIPRTEKQFERMVQKFLTDTIATLALSIPAYGSALIRALLDDLAQWDYHTRPCSLALLLLSSMASEVSEAEDDDDYSDEEEEEEETEEAGKEEDATSPSGLMRSYSQETRALMAKMLTWLVAERGRILQLPQRLSTLDERHAMMHHLLTTTRHIITIIHAPPIHQSAAALYDSGVWDPLLATIRLSLIPMDFDITVDELIESLRSVILRTFDYVEDAPRWPSRDAASLLLFQRLIETRADYLALMKLTDEYRIKESRRFAGGQPADEDEDEEASDKFDDYDHAIGWYDSAMEGFSRIVCEIGSVEMPWIVIPRSQAESGPFIQFLDLLCMFVQHPYDRHQVEAAMDTFSSFVLDVKELKDRSHLPQNTMLRVADGVLSAISYPLGFVTWLPDVEVENVSIPGTIFFSQEYDGEVADFNRFREVVAIGFEEWLIDDVGPLQFLHWLVTKLEEPPQQVHAAYPIPPSRVVWQKDEGILIALIMLEPKLHKCALIHAVETADNPSALSPAQLTEYTTLNELLTKVYGRISSYINFQTRTTASIHPLLLAAACGFIQNYNWFVGLPHPANQPTAAQYLEMIVPFLIACIPSTQVEPKQRITSPPFQTKSALTLTHASNMAGVTFLAITQNTTTRQILIRHPTLLSQIVTYLTATPEFSQYIIVPMRRLWLEGLAAVVGSIAHIDPTDTILSTQCASHTQAIQMWQQITQPLLVEAHSIITAFNARFQANPKLQLTPNQRDEFHFAINAPLRTIRNMLGAVLQDDIVPRIDQLNQRIVAVEAAAATAGAAAPTPPPSFIFAFYQLIQPLLTEVIRVSLNKRGGKPAALSLSIVVDIRSWLVQLLYPNELRPVLQDLLQSSMHIYQLQPLSQVLRLFEHAIKAHQFGRRPEFRDTWTSLIGQIFNLTLEHYNTHTSTDAMVSPDLYDEFFILAIALLEFATIPFIQNPSQTLSQIFKFCITVLDPSNRQWNDECVHFLYTLLSRVDIFDEQLALEIGKAAARDVKRIVRDTYKEYGGAILSKLVRNMEGVKRYQLSDKSTAAFYQLFQVHVTRYPHLTRRWKKLGLMTDKVLGMLDIYDEHLARIRKAKGIAHPDHPAFAESDDEAEGEQPTDSAMG